jgi:transcriptional regulator with XRE-family HTH domain
MRAITGSSLRGELEAMAVPFEAVRKQIDGVRGWLRTVRQMDAAAVKEIASRMGVLKREILRLEVAEERERITLGKLREVANAMDYELVYSFVPKQTTFEELAQREVTKKKEARENRMRERKQKEIEKRYKRYGQLSPLALIALEVKRGLRKCGIKILGKKKPAKKSEGWGVRPDWGKRCVHCQR